MHNITRPAKIQFLFTKFNKFKFFTQANITNAEGKSRFSMEIILVIVRAEESRRRRLQGERFGEDDRYEI